MNAGKNLLKGDTEKYGTLIDEFNSWKASAADWPPEKAIHLRPAMVPEGDAERGCGVFRRSGELVIALDLIWLAPFPTTQVKLNGKATVLGAEIDYRIEHLITGASGGPKHLLASSIAPIVLRLEPITSVNLSLIGDAYCKHADSSLTANSAQLHHARLVKLHALSIGMYGPWEGYQVNWHAPTPLYLWVPVL